MVEVAGTLGKAVEAVKALGSWVAKARAQGVKATATVAVERVMVMVEEARATVEEVRAMEA